MANLKNWLPEMSIEERVWFDGCPKAVLFAIAQQFAMRIADDFTAEAALETMRTEWTALRSNGLVPQKPFNPDKKVAAIHAFAAKRATWTAA